MPCPYCATPTPTEMTRRTTLLLPDVPLPCLPTDM